MGKFSHLTYNTIIFIFGFKSTILLSAFYISSLLYVVSSLLSLPPARIISFNYLPLLIWKLFTFLQFFRSYPKITAYLLNKS